MKSVPLFIALALLSAVFVSHAPAAEKQNLHAVVAGVRSFQDPSITPLKLSDKDAVDFAEFLKEREDLLGKVHVTLLLNEQATRANIIAAMKERFAGATKDDIAVVFLSGHGTPHPTDPRQYYFITHDTRGDDLAGSALMVNDKQLFGQVPTEKLLLLADACHSGGFVTGVDLENVAKGPAEQFAVFRELPGRVAMSSSAPTEVSYERKTFGNSIFTHFLIKGLRGEAARPSPANPNAGGKITVQTLFDYVRDNTSGATKGKQNPVMYASKTTRTATIATPPVFAKPLQVKVRFLCRDDKGSPQPLNDGMTLKSGQRLGIDFEPASDCYVYIYWWDTSGKVWKMFPNPKYGDADPKVTGGRKYQLPAKQGAAHWYVLDNNPGTETIYFVASREPNKKLEGLYAELETVVAQAQTGEAGKALAEKIEREVNLMGPAKETVSRDEGAPGVGGNRTELFNRLGSVIRVSGADAIFKVQFKHE